MVFSGMGMLGAAKASGVWSKFKLISLWIPCSKRELAFFLFLVNASASCNGEFISLFAVVPRLFTQSVDFRISWAHFVVRFTFPPFLLNFSGHIELNTPLLIAESQNVIRCLRFKKKLWNFCFLRLNVVFAESKFRKLSTHFASSNFH